MADFAASAGQQEKDTGRSLLGPCFLERGQVVLDGYSYIHGYFMAQFIEMTLFTVHKQSLLQNLPKNDMC